MSDDLRDSDGETPLGATEMQALRRLAEPVPKHVPPAPEELWARRYRVMNSIGSGGMGDVFLARDVLLDRLVALKLLRSTSDESFVDERRLLREARAAARAEHERIARVYDAGTWNDRAFIAMEYVRGETLREWMKKHRPEPQEVIAIVQQLLEGLSALHERGLVHRDLKPENVMVSQNGNLRILDLGVARRVPLADAADKLTDAPGTLTLGFGVGTPGYMAPEQWQGGNADARADLFALGVIIYELVVGRAPFRGATNRDVREQTLHAVVPLMEPEWDDMPPQLKDTVKSALARNPEARCMNVAAMAEGLSSLFRPSQAPLSGPRLPSIRPSGQDSARPGSLAPSVVVASLRGLPHTRPLVRIMAGALVAAAVAVLTHRLMSEGGVAGNARAGMIALPGGSFQMGLDPGSLAAQCSTYPKGCPPEVQQETPARTETVAPFQIDRREITNQEFADFLNTIAPSIHVQFDEDQGYLRFVRYRLRSGDDFLLYDLWKETRGVELLPDSSFRPRTGFEKLPVTLVTWLGARLFCKNLAKRLPSEAEWEFAARGTEGRAFPWGSGKPDCRSVHLPSNGFLPILNPQRCDNEREVPFPVASAPGDRTPEGVEDLAGNVAEWVDDSDLVDRDEATYASRLRAEASATYRGGAFDADFLARATGRNFRLAFNVAQNLGFRCAQSMTISP